MNTTLIAIREHNPCTNGWKKLLSHLEKTKADDELLPITTILDSNGLDDALWCLRAVDGHAREMRLYAVWCARQVQSQLEDQRSLTALDVAERHANGAASNDELGAARAAARAAADDARAAARAADDDARAAADDAAYAAWSAADDAAHAAWSAADDAANAGASRAAQAAELQRICAEIAAGRDPYPAAGEVTPMTHPYLTDWRESHLNEWREADMAERITLEAPEMRPCNQVAAVPTSTGLLIGCAYRRPMPQPSADAERIQAALLAKPARRASDGWAFWLIFAACVLVFALFSGCTVPSDTQAAADTAADLRDAQQQASAEWRAELKHAQALAMLAARIHK